MNTREVFEKAIVTLYHLISLADGEISKREEQLCALMKNTEKISEEFFNETMDHLNKISNNEVYGECIRLLNSLKKEEQITCLAWMRHIANCDGFMAREEWALIFKIYKKELKLDLNEIMNYELPMLADI